MPTPAALISQHRTPLMGIAILWVMLFHANINLPDVLYAIKRIGYGGVDIFFLLSGLGLMYGWMQKSYQFSSFIKRRLLRILPAFWLVVIPYALLMLLVSDAKWLDVLYMILGLDFYIEGEKRFWFVPAIIVCYLIFPAYAYFYLKARNKLIFTLIAIGSALALSLALTGTQSSHLLLLTIRLADFFVGVYIGERLTQKADDYLPRSVWINVLLIALVCGILWYVFSHYPPITRWLYGLAWFPFLLMTFSLAYLIVLAWETWLSGKNYFLQKISQFINFCGTHSLELYLTHVFIFRVGEALQPKLPLPAIWHSINIGKIPEYLLYSIIAIFSALILKKIVNWSLAKFQL